MLSAGSGLLNKSRVDLAILEMKADKKSVQKVIAMIEFKAHAIARPEPAYYGLEFQNDVKKMRKFRSQGGIFADADLYFICLANWIASLKSGLSS